MSGVCFENGLPGGWEEWSFLGKNFSALSLRKRFGRRFYKAELVRLTNLTDQARWSSLQLAWAIQEGSEPAGAS